MNDEPIIQYQVRLWKCWKCGYVNESPRITCENCGSPENRYPEDAGEMEDGRFYCVICATKDPGNHNEDAHRAFEDWIKKHRSIDRSGMPTILLIICFPAIIWLGIIGALLLSGP